MNIFLDIETIGTEDAAVIAEIAAGISPPGNISKPETIAAWLSEKKPAAVAEAVARTSFDGGLGRVICFGYAVDTGAAATIVGDERDILGRIASLIQTREQATVIGHNVAWDVRFLWQRFMVNAMIPPTWLRAATRAKPWDVTDTMLLWNPDRERRTSLDKLCRTLGIPTPKGDLDGSKVWEAYRAGEIDRIAEYCRGDVEAMRACYWRLAA